MVMVIVFNATFNHISVISWWSVLLLEEPVWVTFQEHGRFFYVNIEEKV
jgi:hypothetical protein